MRRTGEDTTASTRSAIGASQSAVARIWSRPSSLSPGLALRQPAGEPLLRGVRRDAVPDQDQRRRRAAGGRPAARGLRRSASSSAASVSGLVDQAPRRPTVTPLRLPSSASLASRSACLFCSRGTQVYVVPNGASRLASVASGRMSGCLIFQRPDICSTTSLESIRTSMSASGANSSASLQPGDQAGVLRDVVGGHPDRGAVLGDHLAGVGVLEHGAVRRRAGVAARAAVGLDDDRPVRPGRVTGRDSGVRTRIRWHSSQRITSSARRGPDRGQLGRVEA